MLNSILTTDTTTSNQSGISAVLPEIVDQLGNHHNQIVKKTANRRLKFDI